MSKMYENNHRFRRTELQIYDNELCFSLLLVYQKSSSKEDHGASGEVIL